MEIVVEVMKRRPILLQGMHHFGETVGPQPGGIDRLELFPAGCTISPDLEAAWVPIIAKQVGGAFGAVELKGWTSIALNTMTGNERRQRTALVF